MDILWEELTAGLPDGRELIRVLLRLLAALILGAIVGIQRERTGKPAGIRTHMLVSLGAALIVVAPLHAGMDSDALSRIIQGLVTGIGFIGGGTILKHQDAHEIEGLTTAAGLWMTAAVGMTAGLGRIGLAVISVIMTWIILALAGKIEIQPVEEHTAKTKD